MVPAKKTKSKKKKKKKNTFAQMIEIISDNTIEFTHELAVWYCELPKFNGERNVSHQRAEALRRQMYDGKWTEGHGEISVAVFPDGSIRRLNGQHRCYARFILEDTSFVPRIRFVKYAVKDEDEYRKLYIRFDNPNTTFVRSSGHLIQMALFGTDEFEGVSKQACSYIAQGYKYWQYGFNNATRKTTIEQLAEDLRGEHNARAKHVAEIVGKISADRKTLSHLARSPVYAAIFETFKFVGIARKFWHLVLDGLFDRKDDPAKILSDYLHRTGLGNKDRSRDVVKLATQDEMYAVCVKCFSFYKNGRRLTKTPPSVGPRPTAR